MYLISPFYFFLLVLSEPEKRAIYDVYGKKGLEADWQIIPRTRTPQEIIEEYERLQRESEERRLQQSTNPRVSIHHRAKYKPQSKHTYWSKVKILE